MAQLPLCPSAQPEMNDCVVFGVIRGTADAPRLTPLRQTQPVTKELLALSKPVDPTEVFRFAAPCAGKACQHFDGLNCRLATRIVRVLPAVVQDAPACQLRPTCRWWQQERIAACLRCPQVVTQTYGPSAELIEAADPRSPA